MLLFLIALIVTNKLGLQPMVNATLLLMPSVLASLLFVFFASIGDFDFQRIYPLIGDGYMTTFFSGLSNLFAFAGIVVLYFLPPYLKDQKNYTNIALVSIGLSCLFLLMSVFTLLCLYPIDSINQQILPLYLASRHISFGRFFQRLDAIFLLIWTISFTAFLNLFLYISSSIFQKLLHLKHNKWIISMLSILIFAIGLIPNSLQQIMMLHNRIYPYTVLVLVFIIGLLLLVLANLKYYFIQKKKGATRKC